MFIPCIKQPVERQGLHILGSGLDARRFIRLHLI